MARSVLGRTSFWRWGLALALTIGVIIWLVTFNFSMALSAGLITATGLGLNLDNVVVVAPLIRLLPTWGRRLFFTAGIVVSVVGVQLFLPVFIVSLVSGLGLGETMHMAAFDSENYSRLQEGAAQFIDAGATSFLMLMGLDYMLDPEKEVHWWRKAEVRLAKLGEHTYLGFGLVGALLLLLAGFATTTNREWLVFDCFGSFVAFAFFHMAGKIIERQAEHSAARGVQLRGAKACLLFMMVLVLESLFSIDSLASAFAITSAIIPIVVGLVASALFMRALLFDMSETDRLSQFKYLQNSAYWAVLFLGVMTYLSAWGVHVPEVVTGFGGTSIILWGVVHSHIENRRAARLGVAA